MMFGRPGNSLILVVCISVRGEHVIEPQVLLKLRTDDLSLGLLLGYMDLRRFPASRQPFLEQWSISSGASPKKISTASQRQGTTPIWRYLSECMGPDVVPGAVVVLLFSSRLAFSMIPTQTIPPHCIKKSSTHSVILVNVELLTWIFTLVDAVISLVS